MGQDKAAVMAIPTMEMAPLEQLDCHSSCLRSVFWFEGGA